MSVLVLPLRKSDGYIGQAPWYCLLFHTSTQKSSSYQRCSPKSLSSRCCLASSRSRLTRCTRDGPLSRMSARPQPMSTLLQVVSLDHWALRSCKTARPDRQQRSIPPCSLENRKSATRGSPLPASNPLLSRQRQPTPITTAPRPTSLSSRRNRMEMPPTQSSTCTRPGETSRLGTLSLRPLMVYPTLRLKSQTAAKSPKSTFSTVTARDTPRPAQPLLPSRPGCTMPRWRMAVGQARTTLISSTPGRTSLARSC